MGGQGAFEAECESEGEVLELSVLRLVCRLCPLLRCVAFVFLWRVRICTVFRFFVRFEVIRLNFVVFIVPPCHLPLPLAFYCSVSLNSEFHVSASSSPVLCVQCSLHDGSLIS